MLLCHFCYKKFNVILKYVDETYPVNAATSEEVDINNINIKDKLIDIRTSTIPTTYGEKTVSLNRLKLAKRDGTGTKSR